MCPLLTLVTKRELKQDFDQRKTFLCVHVQVIMHMWVGTIFSCYK